MRLKPKNISAIDYLLISKGSPITLPIIPPEDFIENNVLEFMKYCPEDLFQLHSSFDYFELNLRLGINTGHDFHVINFKDVDFIHEFLNSNRLKLIFIEKDNVLCKEIIGTIQNKNDSLTYLHLFGKEGMGHAGKIFVNTPNEFIKNIIQFQALIIKGLQLSQDEVSPSISLEYKNFNTFSSFKATRSNYFLIKRIIGNFFHEEEIDTSSAVIEHAKDSTNANVHGDSWQRQNLFIDQIKKIDFFTNLCFSHKIIERVSSNQTVFSPIVMIFPFHNPDLKKIYGEKSKVTLLQAEQTNNYINLPPIAKPDDMIASGILISQRLGYLDDVAFLHSTFCKSPVIRFPLKGKSIYRELSMFRVDNPGYTSKTISRKKINKFIKEFGKLLCNTFVSPELQKFISKRDGQVVVISDLPIEWLLFDDIPFSFTHDICRLPETSLHGLMSLYTRNNTFEFSITKDILDKTLVIFGCTEDNFLIWQRTAKELAKEKKFNTVECTTLAEVKSAVAHYKPDFLIFDCHGGYDTTSKSTYLWIGSEKLTGEYIIENNIAAPLIFLSACGTAPTYGTFNIVANAFFEAGALSVTTTYLPINIDTGSILYLRILNKLDLAATNVIHKNWLEFLSHLIRTSAINEAYLMLKRKNKNFKYEDYSTSNVTSLTESLFFHKRRTLFRNLDKRIQKLSNADLEYFSKLVPEYLFYSNLGRSDLILFDTWSEEHLKKNDMK